MRKKVGRVYLGYENYIEVYVTDQGDAGHSVCPADDDSKRSCWVMEIGIAKNWCSALITLLHELIEISMVVLHKSYIPVTYWSSKTDVRFFLLNHQELEEVCCRTGDALNHIQPKIKKAWRDFHKPKKKKKRRRKK